MPISRSLIKDVLGSELGSDPKLSVTDFHKFLTIHQSEPAAQSHQEVAERIRAFLKPNRDVQEPYMTEHEFLDWLFSKENSLFDKENHSRVTQDMTRPLSHYWINSSHNTYLTGDQIQSESSVDAYARCLRMGCRSVELDCWDGPESMKDGPFIYHGHTLTTKIKFMDVVKTIREHG